MDNILLVENRDDVVRDLTEIFDETGREYRFLRFREPREFVLWGQDILKSLAASQTDGTDPTKKSALSFGIQKEQYSLVILNGELFGPEQIGVLEKIINALTKNQQVVGSILPICYIAHEADEKFNVDKFDHPNIANILFKPFDKVVAVGKVLWALEGVRAKDKVEIYKEAPTENIEMVKSLTCQGFNGRGFKTYSDTEISVKALGYYYGLPFIAESSENGVFAICRSSKLEQPKASPPKIRVSQLTTTPKSPTKPYYNNFFEFLNLDVKQIRGLRLALSRGILDLTSALNQAKSISLAEMRLQIAIVHENEVVSKFFQEQIVAVVDPVDVILYSNLSEFLLAVNPSTGASEIAKVMDEYQGPRDEVVMLWDETGTFFLQFEKAPLARNIYGISFENMSDFKRQMNQFLKHEEDRKRFIQFWGHGTYVENFVFETVVGGKNFYNAICSREKVTFPGSKKTAIKFVVRPATAAETERYLVSVHKITEPFTVAFISDKLTDTRDEQFWFQVRKNMKLNSHGVESTICRIGPDPLIGLESKKFIEKFDGFFTEVTDREYLGLFLTGIKKNLKIKEEAKGELQNKLDGEFPLLSAVEVKLRSVSEVNLSFSYPRDMGVYSIRYFRLRDPETNKKVSLTAKCIHVEPDEKEKGMFLHHFVFYGTREQENHLIRRWMIEAYYSKKTEQAAS